MKSFVEVELGSLNILRIRTATRISFHWPSLKESFARDPHWNGLVRVIVCPYPALKQLTFVTVTPNIFCEDTIQSSPFTFALSEGHNRPSPKWPFGGLANSLCEGHTGLPEGNRHMLKMTFFWGSIPSLRLYFVMVIASPHSFKAFGDEWSLPLEAAISMPHSFYLETNTAGGTMSPIISSQQPDEINISDEYNWTNLFYFTTAHEHYCT